MDILSENEVLFEVQEKVQLKDAKIIDVIFK